MTWLDIVGSLAGAFTTISFIPQVVKTWRSGCAQDLSLFMFALFSAGVLLWLIYGIGMHSLPIMFANGITLVLALSILLLKIRHSLRQRGSQTVDIQRRTGTEEPCGWRAIRSYKRVFSSQARRAG